MKYYIANWKSNKTIAEAQAWVRDFEHEFSQAEETEIEKQIVVAPPFPLLPVMAEELSQVEEAALGLGVQTLSPFSAGSYTGAVAARSLTGLGVSYAILGHSERRKYFDETHQQVANQVDQALQNGIKPIVCVDQDYVEAQANALDDDQRQQCLVAYEPLGAIGTGQNQDVGTVKKVAAKIKAAFSQVPVIYGGSVDERNVSEYLLVTDGVLVGGASLDVEQFVQLVSE